MQNTDLIKALRCLGSQNEYGDCHADNYNYLHIDEENIHDAPMRCGEFEGHICCPYFQTKYGVCFEDGECQELLNEAANILETIRSEIEAQEGK